MAQFGSKVHGQRKATTSIRFHPETLDRLHAAADAHPYKLTVSQIIERGIELALTELEAAK